MNWPNELKPFNAPPPEKVPPEAGIKVVGAMLAVFPHIWLEAYARFTVGSGLTVTVTLEDAAADVQPFNTECAFILVWVERIIRNGVAPVVSLQIKLAPVVVEEAVNLRELPLQIEVDPEGVIVGVAGTGLTVTVIRSDATDSQNVGVAPIPTTVKLLAPVKLRVFEALPSLHLKVEALVDPIVRLVEPPAQKLVAPLVIVGFDGFGWTSIITVLIRVVSGIAPPPSITTVQVIVSFAGAEAVKVTRVDPVSFVVLGIPEGLTLPPEVEVKAKVFIFALFVPIIVAEILGPIAPWQPSVILVLNCKLRRMPGVPPHPSTPQKTKTASSATRNT